MTDDKAWLALINGWQKDAKHYEAGLQKVRRYATNRNQEIVEMIDDILSWEDTPE